MNEYGSILGYWIIAALVVVLGLLGLVLAAGASDGGMLYFGMALAAFAVGYVFFAIHRTHEDAAG